jgi:dipeptidyl aminopeptidase/acylaminoacyl peptidase
MARYAHLPLTVIVLIAAARIAGAQQAAAFTAEDMLEVASIRVLDVSDDGRRIAATVRRPVDNPTTDHRRYGDPSYLAPSRVTLQIIDGRSGAVDVPFEELVNVGDAAWSSDGQQLAILLAREPTTPEGFPATALYIWNAATRSVTLVTLQGPETIEVSSNLAWTPDNRSIFVALRNPELDREARQRFRLLTDGPVVVHASSDPFLEWDALRRSSRSRSVAVVDPRTGAVRAAIPQNRLTSYQPSRDGSFLTVMEDVTEKTDYDRIGGTENLLKYVDAKTGESRVLLPAADLTGVQLRWSDDGRWFA